MDSPSSRFFFWWRWLTAVTAGVILFGALMFLAPALTLKLFGLLVYGSPLALEAFGPRAVAYITLTHGVLGAVMVGWGTALMLILAGPFRRVSTPAWRTLVISLLVWFLPDTLFSLAAGFWRNALLNLVFALLYFPALAATRGFFARERA